MKTQREKKGSVQEGWIALKFQSWEWIPLPYFPLSLRTFSIPSLEGWGSPHDWSKVEKSFYFLGQQAFVPFYFVVVEKKAKKRPEKGQENADYRFFLFGTSSLSKVGVTRRQGPLKYLGFFSVNRSDSKLINQTRLVHYLPRSCALHKILSYLTLLNKFI